MTLEIRVRSRRKAPRPAYSDRRDVAPPPEAAVNPAQPAGESDNDNDKVWPLLPFPDGWYGS